MDNHSTDNTNHMIENKFSHVHLIQNQANVGFAAGINQAIDVSSGEYIVILNPDTITSPDSVTILAEFLDRHPEVVVCGPKILNEDGSFQKSCRRGAPRPWAVISYFFLLN